MTAKVGTPVRLVENFISGGPPWELQPPADGTLLVVCGECGFTWDADHTVEMREGGQVGYECPRCTLTAAVAVMGEQETRLAAATAIVDELVTARAELAHLRPQNELLRRESVALRKAAIALKEVAERRLGPQWGSLLRLAVEALGDEVGT